MCADTRIGYRRATVKPVEGSSTVLIVQFSPKLYLTTAVFAAVTFGSLGPSDADSPGFLDQSLASQLVQSMTQRRILQTDRKSTRLNSRHSLASSMPSYACNNK